MSEVSVRELERRYFASELRVDGAPGEMTRIVGFGAVFNSLSEDLGGFREMILPGAFASAISEDDVRALFNHDANLILGRNRAGTLRLSEDELGLRYEIDPPDTSYARDLMVSLARGDVNQSSFGFVVDEESWQHPNSERSYPIRVLHRVRLFDVSPVVFPAYAATSVAVRACEMAKNLGRATQDKNAAETAGRLARRRNFLNLKLREK